MKKINRKKYEKLINNLENNSEIKNKLQKLFELNKEKQKKKNDNLIKILSNPQMIITAYGNIQANKKALTKGVDPKDTTDGFNSNVVEKMCNDLRNSVYKWKDITQVEIPKLGGKKKRPLGLPTFTNKLVQESLRVILNVIYEPIFQNYEVSHGSRPKRGTHTAITQLSHKGQGMTICAGRRWRKDGDGFTKKH